MNFLAVQISVVALFFIYTTLAKELSLTLIRSTQDDAEKIQKRNWSNCIRSYYWNPCTEDYGYCDDCDDGYFECSGMPKNADCYPVDGGYSKGGSVTCQLYPICLNIVMCKNENGDEVQVRQSCCDTSDSDIITCKCGHWEVDFTNEYEQQGYHICAYGPAKQ